MILAFELTWTGYLHAPGNGATLQTLARAFPTQKIIVFAEATHIAELRRDGTLLQCGNLRFEPIEIYPKLRGKTQIVSLGRLLREITTLARAVRRADPGEDCLVFLLSATSTAIVAARCVLALAGRRRMAVHVGLHGNLYDVTGWRTRNPLLRALDLRSILTRLRSPRIRYLVLESAIRAEAQRLLPGIGERIDVLPLPINTAEIPVGARSRPAGPLKVGFVGLATQAKGIDIFLRLASALRSDLAGCMEFHLVGRTQVGTDLAPYGVLAHEVSSEPVERSDFCRRLENLDYIVLPFREGYYNLSASGALIDAVTYLKPVIAMRVPLVEQLFAQGGDIGFLCDDEEAMRAALLEVARGDGDRYKRQVKAMARLRDSRMPTALAASYRKVVDDKFAGLIALAPPDRISAPGAPAQARSEEPHSGTSSLASTAKT